MAGGEEISTYSRIQGTSFTALWWWWCWWLWCEEIHEVPIGFVVHRQYVYLTHTHTHTHSILSLHKWSCFSLLEYCSIDVLICFLIKKDVFFANYLNFSHFTFSLSWSTNWVIFEQQQQEHLWMHLEFSFQVYWMHSLLTTVHLVLMFLMMLLLWHYGHLLLRSFPLNWPLLEI
jgi:hypothetical protein